MSHPGCPGLGKVPDISWVIAGGLRLTIRGGRRLHLVLSLKSHWPRQMLLAPGCLPMTMMPVEMHVQLIALAKLLSSGTGMKLELAQFGLRSRKVAFYGLEEIVDKVNNHCFDCG